MNLTASEVTEKKSPKLQRTSKNTPSTKQTKESRIKQANKHWGAPETAEHTHLKRQETITHTHTHTGGTNQAGNRWHTHGGDEKPAKNREENLSGETLQTTPSLFVKWFKIYILDLETLTRRREWNTRWAVFLNSCLDQEFPTVLSDRLKLNKHKKRAPLDRESLRLCCLASLPLAWEPLLRWNFAMRGQLSGCFSPHRWCN